MACITGPLTNDAAVRITRHGKVVLLSIARSVDGETAVRVFGKSARIAVLKKGDTVRVRLSGSSGSVIEADATTSKWTPRTRRACPRPPIKGGDHGRPHRRPRPRQEMYCGWSSY